MKNTTVSDSVNHKPLRIFIIVTASILVSETIAVIVISGVRNPLEEISEVLILTVLISSLVYFFLIRPLTVEIALRLSAEKNLKNERDRLEQVTSSIGAGLAVIDRDYKVIWSNRLLMENFDSVQGANCFNAFKQNHEGPCTECGVREVLENNLTQHISEHKLTDCQGHTGWYQVFVTPIVEHDGVINSALELILPINQRKFVEESLVLSQAQFRSLVENSIDWVWEIDAQGYYTYVGPQCRTTLGYECEELIGMTPFMLMTDEESNRLKPIFDKIAFHRKPFKLLENCLIHKNGTIVVMETSGAPFFDNDGRFCGYRGIDRDISERKELEKLQASYQHQLELKVNEQTIQLQNLLAEQQLNFAELKAVESSLRQSEDRFRQLFEQNRDAIILFDCNTGAVRDGNSAALATFECTYSSLLAMTWNDFCLLDDKNNALELNDMGRQGEFLILRSGATTHTSKQLIVSIWGKRLQLEGRQMLFCSLRDITEKTRLEKEAQIVQTKLIQTNKMTSLGFLVAGIAHEINNPNNNILLSAQLLKSIWQDVLPILDRLYQEEGDFILGGDYYTEVRESVTKYFKMITDGSRRIEIIINNLRDFTIKSKSELAQDVDINQIASISVSILQHQIKKYTRNFSVTLSNESLKIKGNQQHLEQVIVNLIVNALQALPSNDREISLTTSSDKKNGYAIITVSDEGCGIPPENLALIFEPFFSTKLETGGTGLGLAISSNIIKEHCGRLEITSKEGAGTTVTIILPLLDSKLQEVH